MTIDRLVALEGAVNFRDLGGYATVDGQHTRWRVLFRADGLGDLTGPDLGVMRELGIRTVVDLRSSHEVSQGRFDVEAHPVDFHHFPFIRSLPEIEEFERAPGFLGAQYTGLLDGASEQIVGALTALAAPEALPAVFHCAAGKDRTGLLAALVLSLVGVPEETVVADYAISGAAMALLRDKLAKKYPNGKRLIGTSDPAFSADPVNMVTLFSYLRERYGTVAGYAAEVGVPAEVIDGLRRALLEPGR